MFSSRSEPDAVDPIISAKPAPFMDYAESEPEDSDDEIAEDDDVMAEDRNENSDSDPQPEPTQDDIEAWMSPQRAREKELLLKAQYRKAGKLGHQNKTKDGTIDKLRAKNAKLTTRYKFERMRRIAAEKVMNDILKMLA